jgi:formyltetrahydrofolate synthetase
MHGGGQKWYRDFHSLTHNQRGPGIAEKGLPNMLIISIPSELRGINPVVCINGFHTILKMRSRWSRKQLKRQAPACCFTLWANGGDGALELADAVRMPVKKRTTSNSSIPMKPNSATE